MKSINKTLRKLIIIAAKNKDYSTAQTIDRIILLLNKKHYERILL